MNFRFGDTAGQSLEEVLTYGISGRNTERKAHSELIEFMFNNLRDDFWKSTLQGSRGAVSKVRKEEVGKIQYGEVKTDTSLIARKPKRRDQFGQRRQQPAYCKL